MKDFMVIDLKKLMKVNGMSNDKSMSKHLKGEKINMKKEKTAYEKFLESKVQYWQQLAYAERQHSYELEQILKKLENKIYGLEKEDK